MSNDKVVPIVLGVIILGLLGIASYFQFEPGNGFKSYIQAEVVGYTDGRSGKSGPDPKFLVELQNGLRVSVRDWGKLPMSYRGPVVLEIQKGSVSGKPIYRVNKERTKVLHNKARQ